MTTNKISKFLAKTVLVFPFTFIVWTLIYNKFDFNNLLFPIIIGIVISTGIIFYNVFDYEKFNDMINLDFLESNHRIEIENTDSNWKIINQIITNNITAQLIEQNEKIIKLQIERKILDSILKISRNDNLILIEIKKKIFKFLPDRAQNYRTIKRLEKRIKTIANNG